MDRGVAGMKFWQGNKYCVKLFHSGLVDLFGWSSGSIPVHRGEQCANFDPETLSS